MILSRRSPIFLFPLLVIASISAAQQPAAKASRPRIAHAAVANIGEQRTARYLDSIRDQPSLLLEFVQQLPKGADLHNHLTGATYAESFINFAAQENLCIERRTLKAVPPDKKAEGQKPACDETRGNLPASRAFDDPVLYRDIIDAWSMRDFVANAHDRSAHDHFFDTFGKFSAAKDGRMGEMLAEAVPRAGQEHLTYVEFILSPDNGAAAKFGLGMGWTGDMAAQRQKLIEKQIERVVADARMNVDQAEAKMRSLLRCGAMNADPGCGVTVRYLYEVHRGLGRDQVFAEMVTGFEMATADPRVVGINLVMPEDELVEMRDFTLHMQMLDYLHKIYPKVHITLHAGELAPKLVPPEGLMFHFRLSLELGHAERIGHGVDVMYERDALGLLQEMAQKKVLVEICLTSNDMILGVKGAEHPLPMYLNYGVPLAIATDDEGVARSDINQEYLLAIQTYALHYPVLKQMSRHSLEYAFIPGPSLWADAKRFRRAECEKDRPEAPEGSLSPECRKFLESSPKAQLQWKLEGEFTAFESKFGH